MIDIEKIKLEIIECLKPLNPNKIILFGSYAYGTPNEDSDIDLFLLKDNLDLEDRREYEINASIMIYDLIKKYNIGFDILSAPTTYIETREDYFYKVDILEKGRVLYEQNSSKRVA
jgi:predicted nucleotidyltransferase